MLRHFAESQRCLTLSFPFSAKNGRPRSLPPGTRARQRTNTCSLPPPLLLLTGYSHRSRTVRIAPDRSCCACWIRSNTLVRPRPRACTSPCDIIFAEKQFCAFQRSEMTIYAMLVHCANVFEAQCHSCPANRLSWCYMVHLGYCMVYMYKLTSIKGYFGQITH